MPRQILLEDQIDQEYIKCCKNNRSQNAGDYFCADIPVVFYLCISYNIKITEYIFRLFDPVHSDFVQSVTIALFIIIVWNSDAWLYQRISLHIYVHYFKFRPFRNRQRFAPLDIILGLQIHITVNGQTLIQDNVFFTSVIFVELLVFIYVVMNRN